MTSQPLPDAVPDDLRTLAVPMGASGPSDADAAVLRGARWLACACGARVVLLRVADVPDDWYLWEPHAAKAAMHVRQGPRLGRAAQALYEAGVPVEVTVVRRVDVAEGIVHGAEDAGADLIFLRATCPTSPAEASLACIAKRVRAHSRCGVVAVYAGSGRLPQYPERVALVSDHALAESVAGRLAAAVAKQYDAPLDHVAGRGGTARDRRVMSTHNGRERPTPPASEHPDGDSSVSTWSPRRLGTARALRTALRRAPDLLVVDGPLDARLLAEAVSETVCWVLMPPQPSAT